MGGRQLPDGDSPGCMLATIRMPYLLLNSSIPKAGPHLRHAALINLVRHSQNGITTARGAFHFLEKEKLSRINQKKLFLEKANYYQSAVYNNRSTISPRQIRCCPERQKRAIYYM